MYQIVKILPIIFCIAAMSFAQENPRFEDYFVNATMRIDYYHIGNATDESDHTGSNLS